MTQLCYTPSETPRNRVARSSRLVHGGPNAKDAEKCVQPGLFYRNMKPTSQVGLYNGGISEDLPSKPRDIWIDYVATSLRDRWNDAEKRVILSRYLHWDVMGYHVGATS